MGNGVEEEAVKLVSCFVSGMSSYRLHPDNHQSFSRYATELLDIIKSLHIEHFFTITVSDDNSMLINGVRVSPDKPRAKEFFLKLRHKAVVTIVISKGVGLTNLRGSLGIWRLQSIFSTPMPI